MVKSRTRKKLDKRKQSNTLPEISAATDYIKRWTNRELVKIEQEENTPICIPTNDGYRIGHYRIKVYPNKTCDLLDNNQVFVHRFEGKVSAILYAIYSIKKRYYKSDEIMQLSKEINKNYTDLVHLQHAVEQVRKNKDFVRVDAIQARLEVAQTRLSIAREKMQVIHRIAKLAKVWE